MANKENAISSNQIKQQQQRANALMRPQSAKHPYLQSKDTNSGPRARPITAGAQRPGGLGQNSASTFALQRPGTAGYGGGGGCIGNSGKLRRPASATHFKSRTDETIKKKKSDPVSRYQNLRNEWSKSTFLKTQGNKQGRKLDLAGFNQWKAVVHNPANYYRKQGGTKVFASARGPTENRRDDLRYNLRAKISRENYVDKELKTFYYKRDA